MSQGGILSATGGGGGTGITTIAGNTGSATGTTVTISGTLPIKTAASGSIVAVAYDDTWNPAVAYVAGDQVQYQNSNYTCLVANTNSNPSTNPTNWVLVASEYLPQQFCTGVLTGGFFHLTGAAPSTTVTADAGIGFMGDAQIQWSAQTATPPAGLVAGQVAYYYIDAAGLLQYQATLLTPTDRRTKIYLGAARVNVATTNWSGAADAAQMANDGFDFVDLALAIGPINYTGNVYSLPTTTTLNKTSGQIFNLNAGDRSLTPENANFVSSNASTPVTFSPTYRAATPGQYVTGAATTTLNLLQWDNGSGTLQTLGNALYTNKRIYQRANSASTIEVLVFYGQNTYATQALALGGLSEENFTIPGVVQELYILRGFITHNGGVTPTSVLTQADKFGVAAAGAGGGTGGGDVLGPASSPTYGAAFYANTTGKLLEAPAAALTNGQLYIGSTGAVPVANPITGSNGVTVTNGAGSIALSGTNATTTTVGVSRYANNADASAQTSTTSALTPSNITSMFATTPLVATQGGTGTATNTLNGILLGNATSAIKATAAPTNGQLLIGSTGVQPVLATLTQGSGITITNGAGTITITSTAGSFSPVANSAAWGNGTGHWTGSLVTPTTLTYQYVKATSPYRVRVLTTLRNNSGSGASGTLDFLYASNTYLPQASSNNANLVYGSVTGGWSSDTNFRAVPNNTVGWLRHGEIR